MNAQPKSEHATWLAAQDQAQREAEKRRLLAELEAARAARQRAVVAEYRLAEQLRRLGRGTPTP